MKERIAFWYLLTEIQPCTFGIKYIFQDVLNKTKDKSITLIISRILSNNAISCGIYSITFIEYMIAGKALDNFGHLLNFFSAGSGCVSISSFASLVGIYVGIISSAVKLKFWALITGIKNYKSTMKKEGEMHDNIVLLAKN